MWRPWRSWGRAARVRTSGPPTSANRASSFHLWWQEVPPGEAVEVSLAVLGRPAVPRLYFWALQVSFDTGGSPGGGCHLGLQWHPGHPGSRAVNFGGYDAAGAVLHGTESLLPSSLGNSNTRDLAWAEGREHRLRIERGSRQGWWRGLVTDASTGRETVVRELGGGGAALVRPVVWSEVFAHCDDPPVAVRWSRPLVLPSGRGPSRYRVTYQPVERGGCTNTEVVVEEGGVVQVTNRERSVPEGALVSVG